MKWVVSVPNMDFSITYEIGDELLKDLKVLNGIDPNEEVKHMIEFEYFLMSANRYKMAVVDEQTLSYMIMNYDNEKDIILDAFKNLAKNMADKNNMENQSETVANTD